VGIRWHNAITAVDDLISSEKEVVFLQADNMSMKSRASFLLTHILFTAVAPP
jgi:hypothetical protein